ncbi:alpha/beta fold hydrolase [Dactylosporangium maewongense]|uniref:Alpha/beta fold hydrolase n=1 Tax=Dactylosporangium maewongense TaxID=634393 RepID=A0ABN1ZI12_9ACTN
MTLVTSLSHHRSGTGEPLVLLHGIGSRWQLWEPVLPALRPHFDVLALDLPGFGASPPTTGASVGASRTGADADVASFADAVTSFAAAAFPGAASFHVAGSSLGGGIALELGRRGVARSVTAFAPIGFWGPLSRRWCQASVTGARVFGRLARPALPALASTAAGRIAVFGLFFGHPARLDPAVCLADVDALVAAPAFTAARSAFAGHRFTDPGALDTIPVTVAWGTRDAILPAFQSRRAAAVLPHARHVSLKGCGHLPFSDAPDTCTTLIRTTIG